VNRLKMVQFLGSASKLVNNLHSPLCR